MHKNEIPRITRDQKRINVPIETDLYRQAKALGIKIQAVCRQAVFEAVEIVRQEQKENFYYEYERNESESDPKTDGTCETSNALFDAMVRLSDESRGRKSSHDRQPDAKRIKGAIKRAAERL